MRVRIRTAISTRPDAREALVELSRGLAVPDAARPDFIALHFAEGLASGMASNSGDLLSAPALHGGTSCLGVMSNDGAAIAGGTGSGAFAIYDPDGSYGTGAAALAEGPQDAARRATLAALAAADRSGESPALVWLTAAPGCEEAVLAGVQQVVGRGTPVLGGSSADNTVAGRWHQLCNGTLSQDAVVVSVLFPSVPVSTAFQGGYAPTGDSGIVTATSGRKLLAIDDRPAAEVYAKWTRGAVPVTGTAARSILSEATLHPLGVVTDHIAGVPFHMLAHPATSHPDGSLDLFADLHTGDRIWQMKGTPDSLIDRAGQVARAAVGSAVGSVPAPLGALVIYCGGCLLAQPGRLPDVVAQVADALQGAPFLGVFSFGEQGIVPPDQSRHGNLMISCTVFGQPDRSRR